MSPKDRPAELTEDELGATRGLLERFVSGIRALVGRRQHHEAPVTKSQVPKPAVAPRAAVATTIPKREPEPAAVRHLPEPRLTDEMLLEQDLNGNDPFVKLLYEVGRDRADTIIKEATRTDVPVNFGVLGASQVGIHGIDPRHPNDLAAVYFCLAQVWANEHNQTRAKKIAAVLQAIEKHRKRAPVSVQAFMDKVRQNVITYINLFNEESAADLQLPW